MPDMALDDILVVDLTGGGAGPFASRLLADFGANVVKVESSQRPDASRMMHVDKRETEKPWNHGGYFHQLHRNKYAIAVDFSHPEGKEVLLRLIRNCDVVIGDFVPGVFEEMGMTYEDLVHINPRLIMLSMHSTAHTNPCPDSIEDGGTAEAASGFCNTVGYGDGVPVAPGSPISVQFGSLNGVFAVLAALAERKTSGKGQLIDLSLQESLECAMEEALFEFTVNGQEPRQTGAAHGFLAPQGVYRCIGEDSWVAITINTDEEWSALCKTVGNPMLASDEYADPMYRSNHKNEIDRLIEEWTVKHDRHQAMHILQAAGVPAGACFDSKDLSKDPHLNERGFFWDLDLDIGFRRHIGAIMNLSETPATLRQLPPDLGQHNEYVLQELLGMSTQQVEHLKRERIIVNAPTS